MYATPWLNNINRSDILPPMTVRKKVKESKEWIMAVMDSFEHIGLLQFRENLKYWDYYRMVDGKMSYQELKEVVPHLGGLQDLLDGVGIPTFLKHYDILGTIVNYLVGKYIDMQDKFHVTDIGEIAENEYLRFKNDQIQKALTQLIDAEVKIKMAEAGYTPEGKQFNSQEEQQQFLQQLEKVKEEFTPKDTKNSAGSKFKTIGIQWGEATLDKDKEAMNLSKREKEEFKDKLLTGRCFREYKIAFDKYSPVTWSPKNTFFSKEVTSEYVQDGEYVGRVMYYTPSEAIKLYGHEISTENQKKLLGGNEMWKNFVGDGVFSGTIEQSIESNFNKPTRVPFDNYIDYNFYLGLQDELGIPMGNMSVFNPDGTETQVDRYLPRMQNHNSGSYSFYANVVRDDFDHRRDLCQVTEVYFIAYDLYGFLTYEDPDTGLVKTAEVTEDILPQFLKENNIKTTYKESIVEIMDSVENNTLKWVYRPVCYEGVKIQSGNLNEPLYLHCKPCDHQIKGDGEFDIKLPVAGYIGKPLATKIMPFQMAYNICMNQLYNLLEKEIGIFFLLDVNLIPSEIDGWGDAEEAMVSMRNMAKDIGLMPVSTSGDMQKNQNNFNQFSTYNLSYAGQMQSRIQLAEVFKQKAYEVVGVNPQMFMNPTKHETAEGVRLNQEASFGQIAEVYEDFSSYNQRALELHLSVAQYCQSNKKDITIPYTKSDASQQFLKISDPSFPLRRIGLIPSKDSKKRKELESFKQYLLSTNTLGSDTLEIAKLISSDSMSEILEIARTEREKRMQQEQAAHERQKELLSQQAEQIEKQSAMEFERDNMLADKNNTTKIQVAQVTAQGRAADKDADPLSVDAINKTAQVALKQNELESKQMMQEREYSRRDQEAEEQRKLKWAELNQKAKELEAKIKISENQKFQSIINKN